MQAGAPRRYPRGFFVLFYSEMLERFGFYTLIFLLVLYLTNKIGMPDAKSTLLYGAFTSLVYLATVAGGFIADRILGFRRAIILGGVFSLVGYLLLTVQAGLYVGLAALVVGNGLFKVNITSLLGSLHDDDTAQRESSFTLYYMGINIGPFAASIGSGFIATKYGYEYAFLMAAAGMIASLVIFVLGQTALSGRGLPPKATVILRRGRHQIPGTVILAISMALSAVLVTALLHNADLAGTAIAVLSALAVGYFMFELIRERPARRNALLALLTLFVFATLFWCIYGQSAISVLLYTERSVDREVLGRIIPASAFQSLNPLFVILLAPLFALLWTWLSRTRFNPSAPVKFVIGLLLLALAFFALKMGGATSSQQPLVPPVWLVTFFFLMTCAEICVSPVGMSIVSRLAPPRLLGFTMGMWFLAEAVADFLSGLLAGFSAVPKGASEAATRQIYESSFSLYALIAFVGVIALLPLARVIGRHIETVDPGQNAHTTIT